MILFNKLSESEKIHRPLSWTLGSLTFSRLALNGARRFPYAVLTPMAAALRVPRSTLESALALQWATGALSPFSGLLIERIGRKRAMLLGMSILTFFMAIAAVGQVAGLIIFGLTVGGLGKMLFDPAMQAYIGDRVPYARRGMAIGITELSWSGSLFIYGPVAALLLSQVGINAIFIFATIMGAVSLVVLWLTLPPDLPSNNSIPDPTVQNNASWHPRTIVRILGTNHSALALLAAGALMSVATESMGIAYEAWLRDSFLLTTIAIGTLTWVISLAEVSGEGIVIFLADRVGKRRMTIIALVAAGFSYFVFPLTGGSLPLAIFMLFIMFATFETNIVVSIPVATEVLPLARGMMMSSYVAALALGRATGTLLGGWMLRTGGFQLNGTVALILNLCAALLVWRFVKES